MAVNRKNLAALHFRPSAQPMSPPNSSATNSANAAQASTNRTSLHPNIGASLNTNNASLNTDNTLKTSNLSQSTAPSPSPGKPQAKSSELQSGISTNELFFLHSAAAEGLTPHELKTVLKGRIGGDIIQSLGYKNAQEGQQRLSNFIDSHYGQLLDRAAQRYGRQDLVNTARLGSNRFGRLNIDNSAESISAAQETQIGDTLLGNFQQALESGTPHTYIERLYRRESGLTAPPSPPTPPISPTAQAADLTPTATTPTESESVAPASQVPKQNWNYVADGSNSADTNEATTDISAVEEANIAAASSTLGGEIPNLPAKEQNEEALIRTAGSTLGDDTASLTAAEQDEEELIRTVSSTLGDDSSDGDSFQSQAEIDNHYDKLEQAYDHLGDLSTSDESAVELATPATETTTQETPSESSAPPAQQPTLAAPEPTNSSVAVEPTNPATETTTQETPSEPPTSPTPPPALVTSAPADSLATTSSSADTTNSSLSPTTLKAAGSALTITSSPSKKPAGKQQTADSDSSPSLKVERGTLKSERGQLSTANIDGSQRADDWKARLQKEVSWQEKQQQTTEQGQPIILPKIRKTTANKSAHRLLAGLAAIGSQGSALPSTPTTAPTQSSTAITPVDSQGGNIAAKLKSGRFSSPLKSINVSDAGRPTPPKPTATPTTFSSSPTPRITKRFSQFYKRYQQSMPWKTTGALSSLFAAKAAYGAETMGSTPGSLPFENTAVTIDSAPFAQQTVSSGAPPTLTQRIRQQATTMGKQAIKEKLGNSAKTLGKKVVGDRLQTAKNALTQSRLGSALGRTGSSIANSKIGRAGKSLSKGLGKFGRGVGKLSSFANKAKLLNPKNWADHLKNELTLKALKALYKLMSLLAKLAIKLAGLLIKLAIVAIKVFIAALPLIITIFATYWLLKGVIAVFETIWEYFFGEDDAANHMARIDGEESVVNPDDCIVVKKTPHTYQIKDPTPDTEVAYNFSVRPNGSDKTEIEIISCKDQVEIKCSEKDSADCTNETRDDFQDTVCRHVPAGPLNGEITFSENYKLPRVGSYTLINTFTVQAKCKVKDKEGNTKEKEQTAEAKARVCVGDKCGGGDLCWPVSGRISQSNYSGVSHSRSDALDVADNKNFDIYAPTDGDYTYRFQANGAGCYVKVNYTKDGQSYTILIMHMKSVPECQSGTTKRNVRQGELIGHVGNTGRVISSRPGGGHHAHVEVRPGGGSQSNSNLFKLFFNGDIKNKGESVSQTCR